MGIQMKLQDLIRSEFVNRRKTFLGAGPMSPVSILSVIELANHYKKPISLIPSRRQIEAKSLGGGYVNNWSTEEFVKFVRERDSGNFIKLSRDHSGPWQLNAFDSNGLPLSYQDAMNEVKESLSTDLSLGFDLIHIDPSQGLRFGRSQEEVESDIIELLEYCYKKQTSNCAYEVGADEQSTVPELVSEAEFKLRRILVEISKQKLPLPLFYVLQTGTKVMETRNIGSFDAKLPVNGMLPASVQLPEIIRMCERNGVLIKEHNADYLSDKALQWHPRFGIHAANIAPEFGVVETRALLSIAKSINDTQFVDQFSEIALKGLRWTKWMLENSNASDREKVEISGHYHLADPTVLEMRRQLCEKLEKKSRDLELEVKNQVKNSIDRYLRWFGYGD
jgi:hypothetical protein